MTLFGSDVPDDADAIDVDRIVDDPNALYVVHAPDDMADEISEWVELVNQQVQATIVTAPEDVRFEVA